MRWAESCSNQMLLASISAAAAVAGVGHIYAQSGRAAFRSRRRDVSERLRTLVLCAGVSCLDVRGTAQMYFYRYGWPRRHEFACAIE